jgi:ectoine hydroxylase-related dioxygenase (phytanoyl-CoA dioxygenase family)
MESFENHKNKLNNEGFTVINDVFTYVQVQNLISTIEQTTHANSNFRIENDLFAIRNLLGEIPEISQYLWTENFNNLIDNLFGADYFLVKAIYFDKSPMSNWLVTWHQDTKISVDKKVETEGFGQWTLKQGLQSVKPTQDVLENIYTIRLHLDDCDETNGALRVIPTTHTLGVLKDSNIQNIDKNAVSCNVSKGGIMIMRPLLLHSSSKSTSESHRRVIHLEFSSKQLPNGLKWRERLERKERQFFTPLSN